MARPNVNTSLIQEIQADLKDLAKKYMQLSAEWSILKNQIKDDKKDRAQNYKNTNRILNILENDDATGATGLVQEVRSNTKFRLDGTTTIKILGIIGGAIGGVIVTIFIKLILKQ